jgi:hypothetical protein
LTIRKLTVGDIVVRSVLLSLAEFGSIVPLGEAILAWFTIVPVARRSTTPATVKVRPLPDGKLGIAMLIFRT